ncbi:phosphopantetheine-protein transferase [Paenibacillus sp. 79R4]|uniref:4'-phosphopantetheinyl transferase family protein n=1 Tax=Paenibacillus sp. 79R4 TaxID=2212847 RepID=UPI0015B8D6D5|nr:4'-phosphopantetheinyl transferase superfamily protein [Paenibacillus sp. 79R4]NWL86332.1 phosphopantetheine-protein transferase [Paenibacillus sp. 79R4]
MLEIYMTPLQHNMNPLHFENLLRLLPLSRQDKIRKFTRREDAYRSLTADILSRWLICDYLGVANEELRIMQNAYGKPMLPGNEGLFFNHSHSGQWIVSALSDAPVGIDIEQRSDIDLRIADRFFSAQEVMDLREIPAEARSDYFFELWTLKESYIKADGRGLSLPLSSFTIRKQRGHIQLDTENSFRSCFFKQYTPDPLYKMAVCALTSDFPETPRIIDFDELYKQFMCVNKMEHDRA